MIQQKLLVSLFFNISDIFSTICLFIFPNCHQRGDDRILRDKNFTKSLESPKGLATPKNGLTEVYSYN